MIKLISGMNSFHGGKAPWSNITVPISAYPPSLPMEDKSLYKWSVTNVIDTDDLFIKTF